MVKITSKSVPVVAAIALLAGVFSVVSVHAETQSCQKTVKPGAGSPSCTTPSISVVKNKKMTVVASAYDSSFPANAYVDIYKGTTLWKSGPMFFGGWNATITSDSSVYYKAKISAASPAVGEKTVKVSISTP